MRSHLLHLVALAFALPLVGCGAKDNDPDVGGVTVGEARALNEAAEMLDEQVIAEGADSPDNSGLDNSGPDNSGPDNNGNASE